MCVGHRAINSCLSSSRVDNCSRSPRSHTSYGPTLAERKAEPYTPPLQPPIFALPINNSPKQNPNTRSAEACRLQRWEKALTLGGSDGSTGPVSTGEVAEPAMLPAAHWRLQGQAERGATDRVQRRRDTLLGSPRRATARRWCATV
jgi:hypothetical protein